MAEGKRYDFERTGIKDFKTAEHIKNAVLDEYRNHPDWIIGEAKIEEQPNGEYRVTVELTHQKQEENRNLMRW